jgi:hypothetical protein
MMDMETDSERAAAPRFRVTLLGTGNPPPVMARFGPSTLVEAGDHTLVFDAGRGVPCVAAAPCGVVARLLWPA